MQGSLSAGSTSVPRSSDRRVLLLAIVLGLLAAGLVLVFLRGVEGRSQAPVPTAPVVVAKEDMAAGVTISTTMIELRALPETAIGRDALTSLDQATNRVVRYPIARGEQVGNLRLIDAPAVRVLSFQIPPGLRGFTIPVTQTKSPVALMAPGDFVDVLATFEVKGSGSAGPAAAPANLPFVPWFGDSADPRGAITLLQNVQVLAVQRAQVEGLPYDPSVRGTPPKDGNVTYLTLAVTPEEAQMLALAVERSRTITVSLRPFGDTETQELSPFVEPVRLPAPADANAGVPVANPGAPAAPPAPRP